MSKANAWKLKKVTATGTHLAAGEVFGGIHMPVAGTTTTLALYDDTSVVAANLLVPTTATLTAGQFVDPVGGVIPTTAARMNANGILLARGLHVVVGGTGSPSFWILFK
jgi:hypothetical protein